MNVSEVMSSEVHTCRGNSMLSDAAALMWEKDCGCLLVLNAEDRPVAMITDRDICMAAQTQGKPLWQIPVASASSRRLFSVRPHESLAAAEALMRDHRVRRIPVLDAAGKPVGMLSMNDLILQAHAKRSDDEGMRSEAILDTLAAISAPRSKRRPPVAAE